MEEKGNLLIVDDDLYVRTIITRKMEACGYNCTAAKDGNEALDTLDNQDFDLVLLDIKMPGPSGIDILPKIIANHPNIGVVMITAVDDTKTVVEAMQLGACDYITKPFCLEELALKVAQAIEHKRDRIAH